MIDVTKLELVTPGAAPPGSLLVEAAKERRYPALLAVVSAGQWNTLIIAEGRLAFEVVDLRQASGAFLRVANPQFVVDLASAVNGFDHSPEIGTLFVTPAGVGILSRLDHGTCGVLLDGTIIDVEYKKLAGFRHWRIQVGGADGEPHVLFTRGGSDRGKG